VYVIGHHSPSVQTIALTIESKERFFHETSYWI